ADGPAPVGGGGVRRLGVPLPATRPHGGGRRLRRGLWLLPRPRPRPLARGRGARAALPGGPRAVSPPRRAHPDARLRARSDDRARRSRDARRGARALRAEVASSSAEGRALRAPAGRRLVEGQQRTAGMADPDPVTVLRIGIVGARFAAELRNCDAVLDAVTRAGVTLCYAEDFVYAPPVAKLRRLLDASGGAILELRAEESHSGSHAAYAARWKTSGGGSLLRMGSHPVGVVLHLKHYEGMLRRGRPIQARAVLADVAQLTRLPAHATQKRYMSTKAEDVEDWAVALITFEDGTKATVHSNDITLGGVRNVVTA